MHIKNQPIKKYVGLFLLLVAVCPPLYAHDIVLDLDKMSGSQTALYYTWMGYKHILPLGFDHILFVLSLFLLSPSLKPILWQSLAFTIAHSVTLGLSMYAVIKPSPAIVEPLIALSILYVALENIFSTTLKPARIGVVFLFGLVHGMGFAGALQELGLPQKSYLSSLVLFNVGVELGQLTIILAAYFLVGKWMRNKPGYRPYIVIPVSLLIALTAAYWTIERIFFN